MAAQVMILRRQHALMELDALRMVRGDWIGLRSQWAVTLALGGSMYVEIADEVLRDLPDAQMLKDEHDKLGLHVSERADAVAAIQSSQLTSAVREALDFLALVCALILRGRLAPAAAYEALGPSIVRNGGPLHRLLTEPERSDYFVAYYPGTATRVAILIDLLWVEAVRADDLDEYQMRRALEVKRRYRTQFSNRSRMRPLAWRLAGPARAVRLDWHLTYAEIPASAWAVRRVGERVWRLIRGWISWRLAGSGTPLSDDDPLADA